MQKKIRDKGEQLLNDIDLLERLSHGVGYGRIKFMEVEKEFIEESESKQEW